MHRRTQCLRPSVHLDRPSDTLPADPPVGRGADGNTSAEDSAQDGVTNPPPINGNNRVATSPDDDGGYLKERLLAYQKAGPLSLSPNPVVKPADPSTPSTPAITGQTTAGQTTTGQTTASTPTARKSPPRVGTTTFVFNMPKAGLRRLRVLAGSTDKTAKVRVELNGKTFTGDLPVGATTQGKPTRTITTPSVFMLSGRHVITFVSVSGRVTVRSPRVI